MADQRLFIWGSGSVPCWRAMIVLYEKGLDFKSELISFSQKEHKSEKVTSINPRGQVCIALSKIRGHQ